MSCIRLRSCPKWRLHFLNRQFFTDQLLALLLEYWQAPLLPCWPHMGISSHKGNKVCTGRCHSVPFICSPPSAWVLASVAWVTFRRVPEASSAPSNGQCLHNPPCLGVEPDLYLRGDNIFNFMLNPALAEHLHSAEWSGDIEWIRPDSPWRDPLSNMGDTICRSQYPECSGNPGEGEMYLAYSWGMRCSIWVGSPTFPCFS